MTSRRVDGQQFHSTSFNDQHEKRTEIFASESNGRLQLLGISPDLVDGILAQARNFKMLDGDQFCGDLF